MPLRLKLKSQDSRLPIDLSGLKIDRLAGQPLTEIERSEVIRGNQRLTLAELFSVSGDAADGECHLAGDLAAVHGVGAGLAAGSVRVEGNVGRHLGAEMLGGRIEVHGDAGDWLGAAMRGGRIHVHGDAADHAGAAYPGNARGMTGGELLIDGNAGNLLGAAMRRGLIAVGGTVGDDPGMRMLAGTILIGGDYGRHVGASMRRGTIVLLNQRANSPTKIESKLLPTFVRANRSNPVFMRLVMAHLHRAGFAAVGNWPDAEYDLFHGDRVELGRGEIFARA
jgi:formylmethanofuran dehydrogenase subunit C